MRVPTLITKYWSCTRCNGSHEKVGTRLALSEPFAHGQGRRRSLARPCTKKSLDTCGVNWPRINNGTHSSGWLLQALAIIASRSGTQITASALRSVQSAQITTSKAVSAIAHGACRDRRSHALRLVTRLFGCRAEQPLSSATNSRRNDLHPALHLSRR